MTHKIQCLAVAVLIATLAIPSPCLGGVARTHPSIAALDSRIIETLLAMGITPVALIDPETQHFAPSQAAQAINLGMLMQPNLELLDQASPELILTSPSFMHAASRFPTATVERLTPYSPDDEANSWQRMTRFTRNLGHLIGEDPRAEQLAQEAEADLCSLRARLSGQQTPPLLVVRLMDHHHARVFGQNSLFHGALEELGLTNAWQGPDNHWGMTLVTIDELMNIDARLVILESPYATSAIREQFTANGIWQHLPSIRRGDAIYLPATFSHFGALPSAYHFADILVEALTTP